MMGFPNSTCETCRRLAKEPPPRPKQPWCAWCHAPITNPIPASGKRHETRMVHYRMDKHVDGGEIAMRCGPVTWR